TAAADGRQVTCMRMRQRDRAVFAQQQIGQWFADDVGATDNDDMLTIEVETGRLQQHDAAQRRTWHQRVAAGPGADNVEYVKAVDVLVCGDGGQHSLVGDVRGQGQLHENAVNFGVAVQRRNECQQLLFRRVRRQVVLE